MRIFGAVFYFFALVMIAGAIGEKSEIVGAITFFVGIVGGMAYMFYRNWAHTHTCPSCSTPRSLNKSGAERQSPKGVTE